MRKWIALAGSALALAACMDYQDDIPCAPEYSIVASFENEAETRSRFLAGENTTDVLWTAGDAFTMVSHDADGFMVAYFATKDDGKTTATFTSANNLEGYSPCYSLYPRKKASYEFIGDEVLLIAPVYPEQKAVAGGVEEGLNIATAMSENWLDDVQFKNVLTFIRFRMSGKAVENLASVTFDAGKLIAGDMTIRWVDGEPNVQFDHYWSPVEAPRSTSVTLTGPFQAGQDYFIAMAPVTLDGFNMTFKDKDGVELYKHSNLQKELKRSRSYDFGTIDIGDKFEPQQEWTVTKYMSRTKGVTPVDICVISEGFTQDELPLFQSLAQGGIDYLFATEPFKSYKDYFNVYFMSVPSHESGASVTDGYGSIVTSKNTYFGARWGEKTFSDMQADDAKVYSFVSENCPEIANGTLKIQDVPILMVINDPRYAGLTRSAEDGRGYSMVPYARDENGDVKTLMWKYPSLSPKDDKPIANSSAAMTSWRTTSSEIMSEVGGYSYGDWRNIVVHELGGHCLSRLADEYWSGYKYISGPIASQTWSVPFGLNLSSDYDSVPWQKDLLDRKDALVAQDPHYSRISIRQGADGYMFGRWRAERVSSMTDNRRYFSAWQRLLIVKRILEKAGETFSLDAFLANDVTTDPMRDETSSGTPGIDIEHAVEVDVLPSPVFTDAQ